MPTKHIPDQVSTSPLGQQGIQVDEKLNELFKKSAGPSQFATQPLQRPVRKQRSKSEEKTTTSALAKKAKDASKVTQALEKKRRGESVVEEEKDSKKRPKLSPSEMKAIESEKNKRTVFVGNVSVDCMSKAGQKELKKKFAEYGTIESVRFRSVAFSELIPRKDAFIAKKLHEKCESANAYILYKDEAMANKALEMNGQVFMDRHLCVDNEANKRPHDRKRSVFLGGLPFDVQDEELWAFFEDCGEIESVRAPRDQKTNVGKGFGYAQFKDRSSVSLALALDGKQFREDTKIRIQRCKIPVSEGGAPSPQKTMRGKSDNVKKPGKFGKNTPTASLFEGVRASKDIAKNFKLQKTSRKSIGKKITSKKAPIKKPISKAASSVTKAKPKSKK